MNCARGGGRGGGHRVGRVELALEGGRHVAVELRARPRRRPLERLEQERRHRERFEDLGVGEDLGARRRVAVMEEVEGLVLGRRDAARGFERELGVRGPAGDPEIDPTERRAARGALHELRVARPPDVGEDVGAQRPVLDGGVARPPDVRPVHHEPAVRALEQRPGRFLVGVREGRPAHAAVRDAPDGRGGPRAGRRVDAELELVAARAGVLDDVAARRFDQGVDEDGVALVALRLDPDGAAGGARRLDELRPGGGRLLEVEAGLARDRPAVPEDLGVRPHGHRGEPALPGGAADRRLDRALGERPRLRPRGSARGIRPRRTRPRTRDRGS